ncbi:reverse transcriptase domain-containing protein [Tanacetum coccineum]
MEIYVQSRSLETSSSKKDRPRRSETPSATPPMLTPAIAELIVGWTVKTPLTVVALVRKGIDMALMLPTEVVRARVALGFLVDLHPRRIAGEVACVEDGARFFESKREWGWESVKEMNHNHVLNNEATKDGVVPFATVASWNNIGTQDENVGQCSTPIKYTADPNEDFVNEQESFLSIKKQPTTKPENCTILHSRHQPLPVTFLLVYSTKFFLMDNEPMWAVDHVVAPTPGSAITISETANKFSIKALFDRLLREILAFSQHENESLTGAWLRMKEMLQNCYGHNLSKADLGASINLMPYSLYAKISLETLKPTKADRSFQYPVGIAENMLVKVGKFIFPADFVILEIEEDSKVPLILR